jgi:hypothetical protein
LVSILSDVNLLTIARPRIKKSKIKAAQSKAKNGQMTKVSKNPASPDADSIDMSILPPTKMDTMLNNSHSRRLPMPNPARRSLKSDFFVICLLSMTKENLQSVSLKNLEESS